MNRLFIIVFLTLLIACKNEQPGVPVPIIPATVTFEFQNVIDGNTIDIENTSYENALNQSFTINSWKYFISNVEFYIDGELKFKEKDSYHYIRHKDELTWKFEILGVPEGMYDEVRYSFGIDSVHNNGDSLNGDIDPGTGMFWPMGGYRFSNFDGVSGSNALAFHIGGNSNYTQLVFNTNIFMEVKAGENTHVHNMVKVDYLFTGVNDIDFSLTNNLATESTAKPLVENLAEGMFMIHHIENPE